MANDERPETPAPVAPTTGWSDDELTALALAADPTEPLRSDAVAWQPFAGATLDSLPSWYMPRAIATRRGRGTRFVVIGVVAVVLLINAAGLCITSGFITIA